MPRINIKGDIIPNEYKEIYEWFGYDSTCPKDIEDAIAGSDGEKVELFISSPGGSVFAAAEMSATLTVYNGEVETTIMGVAASAASLFLPLGNCRMHYLALLMVHNTALGGVSGDYHAMDKASALLKEANEACSNAYALKSGRSKEEILEMMDKETWISAKKAVELGLVDEILGVDDIEKLDPQNTLAFQGVSPTNVFGLTLTKEQISQAKSEIMKVDNKKDISKESETEDDQELQNKQRANQILEDIDLI